MSDSTSVPAPTSAQINAYPGKLALSGDPAPELAENHSFCLGVTQTLLAQAVNLLENRRDARSASERFDADESIDRFFKKLTRFDR